MGNSRLLATTLTLLLACWAASCGRSENDRPRVAVVMKSLANEFFKTMEEGARSHHLAHSEEYDLIINGIRDEQDVGQQVAIIEQVIASGADALVLAPADSQALVPICRRAIEAGLVVVNIDNRLDQALLQEQQLSIPFVGPDNRKGASQSAACLEPLLQPGAPVVILEGVPNAFNAIQRRLGFEDVIARNGWNLIDSQTAYWETDRAHQAAAALLAEHPRLAAFLCANDSMALGAAAAIRSAGRTGSVQVVGFDNIAAVGQLMAQGEVVCTVDQHADQLAVFGIQYALRMLAGEADPVDLETPVNLVTR